MNNFIYHVCAFRVDLTTKKVAMTSDFLLFDTEFN